MAYNVAVVYSATRQGKPISRAYDLTDAEQVRELREVRLPLMSDVELRSLRAEVLVAPAYLRQKASVQELLADLNRRVGA